MLDLSQVTGMRGVRVRLLLVTFSFLILIELKIKSLKVLTRSLSAGGERISNKSLRTATDGVVSHHVTPGVDPADSDTRVGTLEVDAGQAGGALTVDDTLGSAARRGTKVSWRRNIFRSEMRRIFPVKPLPGRQVQMGL